MSHTIAGITMPESHMARDLTQLIRDTESDLLFHHSTRVYPFDALTGQRKGLPCDPELRYAGAMFHNIGLTDAYRDSPLRFEVDGANAARLPAQLRHSGSLGRHCLGRDRAAYQARDSRTQKGGGCAPH
jgi:hypothetical protein